MFHHHASGSPVVNLLNAKVRIIDNVYEEMLVGAELTDVESSTYEFRDNVVTAAWNTVTSYDDCLGPSAVCGFAGSRLLISGDVFQGSSLSVDGTFSPTTKCRITGNTLVDTGDPQLKLFARTQNVLAVGFTSYVDLGTSNKVVP